MFQWLVLGLLSVLPGGTPAVPASSPPPPAAALPELPCTDYRRIRAELGQTYAEEPVSAGLQSNGHLLQLFASAERDSWTMVSLAPDGQACVVAAGADWRSLRPDDPAGADPAQAAPEEGA